MTAPSNAATAPSIASSSWACDTLLRSGPGPWQLRPSAMPAAVAEAFQLRKLVLG